MTTRIKTATSRLKTIPRPDQNPFDFKYMLYRRAIIKTFIKLNLRQQARNPVMFIVTVASVLTTALFIWMLLPGSDESPVAIGLVATWLWFTLLLTNFAQTLAGGYGQIWTETLRRVRRQVTAKKLSKPEHKDDYEIIPATSLSWGDVVLVEAGEIIPADGEVIEGTAPVDESLLTNQHTPIIREAGEDFNAVTGGTRVLSDWLVVQIKARSGEGLLDHIVNLVEQVKHRSPPHKTFLKILLIGSTIVCLLAVVSGLFFSYYSLNINDWDFFMAIITLITLLIALSPTTSSELLSIIDRVGLDCLMRHNIIPLREQDAMEMAGNVDVVLLDKHTTIIPGYRQAVELIPLNNSPITQLAQVARLVALTDEAPEGRSIITLAKKVLGPNTKDGMTLKPPMKPSSAGFIPGVWRGEKSGGTPPTPPTPPAPSAAPTGTHVVPYSAETGLSGLDFNGMRIRKGTPGAMIAYMQAHGHPPPSDLNNVSKRVVCQGGVPLVLALNGQIIGIIHLRDLVNKYLKERLIRLRQMGIKTIMTTDDSSIAAAMAAAEAGVDDFLALATSEAKLALIQRHQTNGQRVATIGSRVNDAPVLLEAYVAVVMNVGAQLARETAVMIDLNSDSARLIELVEIGRQQQVTRRALTAFSMVTDVAKYVVLIPVIFASIHPLLGRLNFMQLSTPISAILATLIFNALSLVAFTPLALQGVSYRLVGTVWRQRYTLLACALGGLIAPFIGIKIIDLILVGLGLV